jgi:hypothetical protein
MRAIVFILLFCIAAPLAFAQEFNAGIVQGLWYSQETVFADRPIRIYAAIRNNTGSDLTGTVEFYDNQKRISRKNVQALDGRIIESWADWTPTYGTHTISANLARIELNKIGEETKEVTVTSALSEETLFVDYDTDNDKEGNQEDKDDDGDGISDEAEKEAGTDPLVKDMPVAVKKNEERETQTITNEDTQDENPSSNDPAGLERYLTDSPAENAFSSITALINDAKKDLDSYREERTQRQQEIASSSLKVNADGFGEISRSTSTANGQLKQLGLGDFIVLVVDLAKTLLNIVYTTLLAALSILLSNPMLVQLGILLLIPFLIIKFASKFGKRPKGFK